MFQDSSISNEDGSKTSANRIRSEALLGEKGVLVIVHEGEEYMLRRTRLGKLILTK